MRKIHLLLILFMIIVLFLIPQIAKAQDDPPPTPDRLLDESLPGEPPFPTVNREIPYWIHNCSVSQDTTVVVDAKLEELNQTRKTQTVILCMPYGSVRDGFLYALTFYNHMQLGYTDLAYRDRGFVWLVQVDESNMKINYAVGEGLPKLDGPEIDTMRNNAIAVYVENNNLDLAMTGLTDEFVAAVTSQYPPVASETNPSQPPVTTGNNSSSGFPVLCIVGIVFGAVFLLFIFLVTSNSRRNRRTYYGGNDYTPSRYDPPSYDPPSYTPPSSPSRPSRPSGSSSSSRPSRPSGSSSRPSASPPRRSGGGGSSARRGG